jgi:hypothetical protein
VPQGRHKLAGAVGEKGGRMKLLPLSLNALSYPSRPSILSGCVFSRAIDEHVHASVFVSFLSCRRALLVELLVYEQELDPFAAYSLVHHCVVDPFGHACMSCMLVWIRAKNDYF